MRLIRNTHGFTIVELLIVIVVIAILAAVTVVAFNGIRTRAENTKTINAVASYVRAIKSYAASKGQFPAQTSFPCLGAASETCGSIPSLSCWGIGSVTGSASFVSDLNTIITTLPQLSTQAVSCNTSGGVAKGGFYYSANGTSAWVYYFLRGDADCGTPAGLTPTKSQAVDASYCRATFTL